MEGKAVFRYDFVDRVWLAVSAVEMNGICGLVPPGPEVMIKKSGAHSPELKPNLRMPAQRLLLGIGLAVVAVMSAGSVALDRTSRSEAAWVNHTLEVSKSLTDMHLLFRRAESAARG
jgi:hypothetical protein